MTNAQRRVLLFVIDQAIAATVRSPLMYSEGFHPRDVRAPTLAALVREKMVRPHRGNQWTISARGLYEMRREVEAKLTALEARFKEQQHSRYAAIREGAVSGLQGCREFRARLGDAVHTFEVDSPNHAQQQEPA